MSGKLNVNQVDINLRKLFIFVEYSLPGAKAGVCCSSGGLGLYNGPEMGLNLGRATPALLGCVSKS